MAIEDFDQVTIAPAKLRPFSKFIMSIGELPTSYLDSLSYAEQITWFCDYLQNHVIPAINNNGEAVEELQNAYASFTQAVNDEVERFENNITTEFNNLEDFVNNYFENNFPALVKDTLDEMAEDGTLENLLNDAAHLTKSYNTYTDLITDSENFTNGLRLKTLGYYEVNDGGAAEYIVTNAADENKYQVELTNSLYLNLIDNGIINVKQLGAYGDSTHDDTNAFTTMFSKNKAIFYIPQGEYIVNNEITILSNCKKIYGDSITKSKIICNGNLFNFGSSSRNFINIENLFLEHNTTTAAGIAINGIFTFSNFNNLRFNYFDKAFNTGSGTYINNFNNITITRCNYGIYHTADNFNNINIKDSFFQNNANCIYINGSSENVNINGCNFEYTTTNIFDIASSSEFICEKSYIELTTGKIFNFHVGFFESTYSLKNCWIYGNQANYNGWLATIPTRSSLDVKPSSLTIEENYISYNDTYKPIAFTSDNTYCYMAVNFINNYFKTTNYITKYFELIDTTNCSNYGNYFNDVPIITDLLYDTYQTLQLYVESAGTRYRRNKNSIKKHIYGQLDVEQTGETLVTINASKYFSKDSGNLPYFIVFVRYSDGVTDAHRCKIDIGGNIYVYNIDSTKTTANIWFDNWY